MIGDAVPSFHVHVDALVVAAALAAPYLWAIARLAPPLDGEEARSARARALSYMTGVLVILVASTWPIHDISEQYLLSVHMFQHLLLSLVAPPLLLLGMPPWLLRRIFRVAPLRWAVRNLARPFFALVIFNGVIVVTHWPLIVNFMLEHHWAHFLGHAALFSASMLMWWPVISPIPEMPSMSYPGRMVYLFLQSIVPTVPASFLTFGSSPLYDFYASVPRLWDVSVMTDQRIAGLLMKLLGGLILWAAIGVIFFKWYAQEHASDGWDALQWRDVEREIRTEMAKR